MPEMLSRMQQQVAEFWQNLDKSQKSRIYIISAVLVVAIAASVILLTRPNNMSLIKNADPKEVGEMVKILTTEKIWNEVGDGGSSITIHAKDNSKAQAALVQQGYPKSAGMTFEDAFKMIKINNTESDKKRLWNYQDSSSLSAKLKALDNVQDAVVTLALPEKSLFIESGKDEVRPTASVVVKPKGELTPKQVQGIVMMVSHSVENLSPKDVIVLDNNSNILNSDIGDEMTDKTNNQYDMTQKKKKELEKSVKDMFYGQFDNFDNIRVVANPVLDFNKKLQQTNALTNPDGQTTGALVTNKQVKEKVVNGGASGAPGVDTNPGTTSTTSYQTGTNTNGSYDKSSIDQQYDYTRIQTQEEKALGVMDPDKSSMTVSLLYGVRVTDENKLSTDFIDQFKKDISAATGIPAAKISVNKYKIAPQAVEKKPISDIVKDIVNTYGLFALMLFLIIGLMVAAIPRKKPVLEAQPELATASAAGGPTGGPRFIVPEMSEHIPEIDLEERSEVKKQIEKFVKQKPDAVAQLLRNWLSDDWEM